MAEVYEWFLSDKDRQALQALLPELSDAQREELLWWMRQRGHDLPERAPVFGADENVVSAQDIINQIDACAASHRKANGLLAMRFLQLARQDDEEIPLGLQLPPAEEFSALPRFPGWFRDTQFAKALEVTKPPDDQTGEDL